MHPDLRTRREFLRTTVLGAALTGSAPAFLTSTWAAMDARTRDAAVQTPTGRDATILVVLQMAGGNDGLNTLVPYRNDHYHRARRRLALPENDLLRIDDSLAWHPALKGFRSLADQGRLSVIQGVGYPNPNRSHFRSTEIWQTASDADRVVREGWIGRFFDHACAGADPTVGVHIGRQMPQAFTARTPTGISLAGPAGGLGRRAPGRNDASMMGAAGGMGMDAGDGAEDPDDTEDSGASIESLGGAPSGPQAVLDFLDRTALDARISSSRVREILGRVGGPVAGYPDSALGQSLSTIGRLIAGGLPTRVYYVSQGGYDTHRDQAGTHARLLGDLGDSIRAFVDDLKGQGNLDRVLLMTFSEFGRRVAENASGGTDHGAAGLLFLAGGKPRSLLCGRYPSLAPEDLVRGDLAYQVDFRRVYADILEGWLGTPSEPVLGGKFERFAVA